ncbi:putative membrane protein [Hyunsoonleella jejuensis]|uniref:Putative membrane protein n=1 Tax=Hyunsoonleella jejuensis TaxID=419940 RepID=A0A1H9FFU3_9FLAO|nr:PH domain-containing protein [Hyunsoonleella jejuensis]SEQ36806.1 putative membrane protein [Hyunsoonleella jejuensis]
MAAKIEIIQQATFNRNIKTYVVLVVSFFLLISFIGIPILIIWLLGLGRYVGKRYYESLECQLTTKHLEFKKGVFFRVEKTIPLENIQDLTFIENPILKYLDLRILKIETAGNSNPKGSDMKLIGIVDSHNFKSKVLEQRELLQSKPETSETSTINKTELLLEEIKLILLDIKKGQNL